MSVGLRGWPRAGLQRLPRPSARSLPAARDRALRRVGLRSLKNKLVLLFLAITATAFAVIYFYVVPELQSNLEGQKLDDLRRVATASSDTLEGVMGREIPARRLDRVVRAVADGANARVTLLGVQRSAVGPDPDLRFFVISDSREEREVPANSRLAAAAVQRRAIRTESTTMQGEELGQIAQPLYFRGRADWVALYSRSFEDVTETVSFIRARVLVATGAALLVALIGGYLVARAVSRRVRRLEEGAEQVAAGKFIEPLPIDSDDELGQLTRTFNEMQKRLEQVDLARKEFIATASHELRTPIFSLSGFVELLQDEELDESTREEFVEAMREQVDRLQKLAVDLLDLSRLDAGSVELASDRVDLSELGRAVVGEFTPALAQHRTNLELRLSRGGVEARCDRERVAQIMRILFENALRHTPDGTHVTVSADRHDGTARFTVSDDGPGLSKESIPHVFERFYTADAARGAGLGLAIAKELAERMEGRISLSARPGSTTFTLELPVLRRYGSS
jgi:two-component system, OmpR family, sensor kinase